jgi:hypothetical protein
VELRLCSRLGSPPGDTGSSSGDLWRGMVPLILGGSGGGEELSRGGRIGASGA